MWRARSVTPYKPELMPEEPVGFPICYSELSLLDIIEYLEKQYRRGGQAGDMEEEEECELEDIGDHYRNLSEVANRLETQADAGGGGEPN